MYESDCPVHYIIWMVLLKQCGSCVILFHRSIHQELACLIWAIAEHIDIEGLDPLLADNPGDPFNVIVSNIHKVLFSVDSNADTTNKVQDIQAVLISAQRLGSHHPRAGQLLTKELEPELVPNFEPKLDAKDVVVGREIQPTAKYKQVHQQDRGRLTDANVVMKDHNYERRGGLDPISSQNAKPPGVELWAAFDVPQHQVDASWKNLTHSLSGILCASITFIESSNAYSAPKWASQSTLVSTAPADELDSGIILEQTLTVVLQPDILKTSSSFPDEFKIQPSWSLSSIFGRKVNGRCVLPKSSNVYFHVERDLVAQLEKLQKNTNAYADNGMGTDVLRRNLGFQISITLDRVHRELEKSSSIMYEYSIKEYNDTEQFDLGLTWKYRVVWSCPLAPLYAGRILIGSGNERGSIAISFKSTELTKGFNVANNVEEKCKLQVYVLQIVPLYIKVYYHTL
ncbi:unnamed protein product [Vicia faba]|uniref:Uncharacterized protein n=1 Tax=Vicia faba TaxID=3906 RepID=A0AAV0Z2G4_VICFA|nr:unnamed protein product [Vicia faba]